MLGMDVFFMMHSAFCWNLTNVKLWKTKTTQIKRGL